MNFSSGVAGVVMVAPSPRVAAGAPPTDRLLRGSLANLVPVGLNRCAMGYIHVRLWGTSCDAPSDLDQEQLRPVAVPIAASFAATVQQQGRLELYFLDVVVPELVQPQPRFTPATRRQPRSLLGNASSFNRANPAAAAAAGAHPALRLRPPTICVGSIAGAPPPCWLLFPSLVVVVVVRRRTEDEGQNDDSLAGEEGVQPATLREYAFDRRVASQERKNPCFGDKLKNGRGEGYLLLTPRIR